MASFAERKKRWNTIEVVNVANKPWLIKTYNPVNERNLDSLKLKSLTRKGVRREEEDDLCFEKVQKIVTISREKGFENQHKISRNRSYWFSLVESSFSNYKRSARCFDSISKNFSLYNY